MRWFNIIQINIVIKHAQLQSNIIILLLARVINLAT